MRLIDADELLSNNKIIATLPTREDAEVVLAKAVEMSPTIPAVQVTRCIQCKNFITEDGLTGVCNFFQSPIKFSADFFCGAADTNK